MIFTLDGREGDKVQKRDILQRPQSLTEAVVMHVRDQIIHGHYPPGFQLTEATLAHELGTSRGTVREAMRVLASLGLVSLTSHHEPRVSTLTPQRAREICTLRALLESFAARTAAEAGRIDEPALAILAEHLRALTEAARRGDLRATVHADMAFHQTLSALAGHELLLEHLRAIQTHAIRVAVYSDFYSPDPTAVVGRHESLLATLRDGDPAVIDQAVWQHVMDAGNTMVEAISSVAPAASGGAQPGRSHPERPGA